jgi:hypothetical protein
VTHTYITNLDLFLTERLLALPRSQYGDGVTVQENVAMTLLMRDLVQFEQVEEAIKLRHQARHALVVVPAGLTRQWQDELPFKFGEQFVVYDRALVAALREIHGQETNLWTLHDQVEPAFVPADGLDLPALRDRVRHLAEAQLAHAGRLEAEREKLERYYRQQEWAVGQIAIENIRRAKRRELLERRHADLAALDRRLALVPDLVSIGMAMVSNT